MLKKFLPWLYGVAGAAVIIFAINLYVNYHFNKQAENDWLNRYYIDCTVGDKHAGLLIQQNAFGEQKAFIYDLEHNRHPAFINIDIDGTFNFQMRRDKTPQYWFDFDFFKRTCTLTKFSGNGYVDYKGKMKWHGDSQCPGPGCP